MLVRASASLHKWIRKRGGELSVLLKLFSGFLIMKILSSKFGVLIMSYAHSILQVSDLNLI